ncbi:MAG TPA: hypothetical protein VK921_11150 [Anditalea sp.]|nr:hypothetical protein [Anditalea sp.]
MLTITIYYIIVVVLHPMNLEAFKYTANYCEENIWHLCQHPLVEGYSNKVLIISNSTKNCPFYCQKTSQENQPVWWDYHVVLMTTKDGVHHIYDFDSTLAFPSLMCEYLNFTFPNSDIWLSKDLPFFKVISSEVYIKTFNSDRNHMKDASGSWIFEPPNWPPIQGGNSLLQDLMNFTENSQEQLISLDEMQLHSNNLQSFFCNI